MKPERFKQVEELYRAVQDCDPNRRSVFLQDACRGDDELRGLVESLLRQNPTRQGVLHRPAWEGASNLFEDPTRTVLMPGEQLGPYKIEGPLGSGGMGEVFRAVDTRLGRSVAIKTSQQQFSERFEREARAISALNHPHICTLYDVGATPSGSGYLVMELIEGESLAARLKRGQLPISETLKYGQQIADALAAAHAKGIVHRDLKPHNIMLSKTGVKVLDFGLAKSTNDANLTASRALMGTPAYMAPEQFEGKDADVRTDIYSLGLVLHEMATGKRALRGETPSTGQLPPLLAHVIENCLAHDPEERWQAAKDVQRELGWAGRQPDPLIPARPRSLYRIWAVVAVAALTVLGSGWLLSQRNVVAVKAARPAEFTLSFSERSSDSEESGFPFPSPDGRYVVFSRTTQKGSLLWLRAIDSTEAQPIPGTEGAVQGFWSPDSRWIGFYADKKLKKMSIAGGVPETIASLASFVDAAWGKNGDIIYRPSNRLALWKIRDTGGTPVQLTELDASQTENSHRAPQFLPDGKRFLFMARCAQRENNALYIGSLDSPRKVRRLMPAQSNVAYVDPGNGRDALLLFYRDGGVWAQPFDADHERLLRQPFRVIENVAYNPQGIQAWFAASSDGSLIVRRPSTSGGTRFSWFLRDGEPSGFLSGASGSQPRISPKGDRVAFNGVDPQSGNRDLFEIELARGIVSRLTTNVANDWFPVWSPDGNQLLFGSDRRGGVTIEAFLKKSLDPGSGESIFQDQVLSPFDWSRDGKWIVFQSSRKDGPLDLNISIASAVGDRKPFDYLATPFREGDPRFSPDSHWIAYSSDESGRYEVYVRPFRGEPAGASGKIQLSIAGGDFPVWRDDGQELYYMTGDADILAVNTRSLGKAAAAPIATKLFRACPESAPATKPMNGDFFGYDFDTRDGRRFLVNCLIEPHETVGVLLNWPLAPKQSP